MGSATSFFAERSPIGRVCAPCRTTLDTWRRCLACLLLLLAMAPASAAGASASRVYRYDIEHPTYGRIGTYTNIIDGPDPDARVSSQLHIAVKIFGVTVYREDATRTEQWHGSRLTSYDSVTVTNGNAIHVVGKAAGSHFVIASPSGTRLAPADVEPSNPWSISMLRDGALMSTKTGKVFRAHVVGPTEAGSDDGDKQRIRQYQVLSDKRESVSFDEHGVPVGFSTENDGVRIRFVLARD
jgi:hypothetical protein